MEKEGFDLHSKRIKGDTFVDRKRDKKKVFQGKDEDEACFVGK